MRYLLGIDVGTTGTKSILFSEDGAHVKSAYKAYPAFEPSANAREQDANDLWDAVCETSKKVCEGHGEEVAALSLSTQGGTLIPTDAHFEPVRRAILWSDGRCEKEARDFAALYGEDYMYKTTGWKLAPRFLTMGIRRLKDDENLNAAYWLSVPSFISAKMTGAPFTDLSSAGIEQTADIKRGAHDKLLLDFANARERELAKIAPSGSAAANISKDAAKALGVTEKTVFVSGAHDQYAALLGSGASEVGDVMLGTGTAWAAVALCDGFDEKSGVPHSVAAAGGAFGRLSSLPSGGACLEWMKNNVLPAGLSYRDIDEKCAGREAARSGLFFCPEKEKAFYGVTLSNDGFDLARAVMEGVAFAVKARLKRVAPAGGVSLFFTGGASKSALWTRITADILNVELKIPPVSDIACLGAAALAGFGAGVFKTPAEGVSRLSGAPASVFPDKCRAAFYKDAYEKYLGLTSGR